MNKNIYEYFADLKSQGVIKQFNKNNKGNINIIDTVYSNVKKGEIKNDTNHYFIKRSDHTQGIASIASSKMYKEIGIITPQIYLLKDNDKKFTTTIQQDVTTIDRVLTTLAHNNIEYNKIERQLFGKYKWQLFYDSNLIGSLLQFMTPECLEQLQNVFLVDELRTDSDRHTKNYFFYRKKDADKYEGIIVIDLEQMAIYNYCVTSKDDFSTFLLTPYSSATPQQVEDYSCYMQRVRDIRELIQDGVLSQNNIETIISALKYDFPKNIKNTCKEKRLHGKDNRLIVTPINRLWEYNRNTIGKDLGL